MIKSLILTSSHVANQTRQMSTGTNLILSQASWKWSEKYFTSRQISIYNYFFLFASRDIEKNIL